MRNTQSGRKGGRSTLLKYGREYYRELAKKSALVPKPPRVPRYPVRVEVYLTSGQAQALDGLVKRTGRRRPQLVRQAVDWWLVHEMGEGGEPKG